MAISSPAPLSSFFLLTIINFKCLKVPSLKWDNLSFSFTFFPFQFHFYRRNEFHILGKSQIRNVKSQGNHYATKLFLLFSSKVKKFLSANVIKWGKSYSVIPWHPLVKWQLLRHWTVELLIPFRLFALSLSFLLSLLVNHTVSLLDICHRFIRVQWRPKAIKKEFCEIYLNFNLEEEIKLSLWTLKKNNLHNIKTKKICYETGPTTTEKGRLGMLFFSFFIIQQYHFSLVKIYRAQSQGRKFIFS